MRKAKKDIDEGDGEGTDREYADRYLRRTGGQEVCIVVGEDATAAVKDALAEEFTVPFGALMIGGPATEDAYLIHTKKGGRLIQTRLRDARMYAAGVLRGMRSERDALREYLTARTPPDGYDPAAKKEVDPATEP